MVVTDVASLFVILPAEINARFCVLNTFELFIIIEDNDLFVAAGMVVLVGVSVCGVLSNKSVGIIVRMVTRLGLEPVAAGEGGGDCYGEGYAMFD